MSNKPQYQAEIPSIKHLEKNYGVFKEKALENNLMPEELINYLNNETEKKFHIPLSEMPLNVSHDFGFAAKGGMVCYILAVATKAIKINNEVVGEHNRVDSSSLLKVSFLHPIGKVGTFKENTSEWHRKNLGRYYEYVREDDVAMKTGERSIYYYGLFTKMDLMPDVYQAIIAHDKDDDQMKFFSEMITDIIKCAIKLVMTEEKNKLK